LLVALGIDGNIVLMTRAREESIGHGTGAGMTRALTVTGGVITSAGLVLAATFGALTVLPLVLLIGDKIWWPSALAKGGAIGCTPSHPRPAPRSHGVGGRGAVRRSGAGAAASMQVRARLGGGWRPDAGRPCSALDDPHTSAPGGRCSSPTRQREAAAQDGTPGPVRSLA
jgi:hypothetical protein